MKRNKKLMAGIAGLLIVILAAGIYLYIPDKAANSSVSINNYRHITVETNKFEPATDEELAFSLEEQLLADGIYQEIRDRKVANGDVVNIAFAGSTDGKTKAADLSQLDYNLEIGSNTFIEGFEQGLVGKKTGKKVKLELVFPLTYPNESYAGHKVVFDVKINYILEKYTKDTLTDEAVDASDYDTAKEYIEAVESAANASKKESWDEETAGLMWDQLIEKAEFTKIDQKLKNKKEEAFDQIYEGYAKALGITVKEYRKNYLHLSKAEFEALREESTLKETKKEMLISLLVEHERIKGDSDEDSLKKLEAKLLKKITIKEIDVQ